MLGTACTDPSQQLLTLLQQVADTYTIGRHQGTSHVCGAAAVKQSKGFQEVAETSIDVLLKVPWFSQLAVAACSTASISRDGTITFGNSSSSASSSSSKSSYSDSVQQQHSQLKQPAHSGSGSQPLEHEAACLAQLQVLIATLLAKTALLQQQQNLQRQHIGLAAHTTGNGSSGQPHTSSNSSFGADQLLLQVLLPQLLQCTASCESSTFSQHWASILCTAARQMHAVDSVHGAALLGTCTQQLQLLLGYQRTSNAGVDSPIQSSSSSSIMSQRHAGSSTSKVTGHLTLGGAACLSLLASIVASDHVQQEMQQQSKGQQQQQDVQCAGQRLIQLEQLINCCMHGVAKTDGDLRGELLSVLVMPLMDAAAQQLEPATYAVLSEQLVLAALGGSSTSSLPSAAVLLASHGSNTGVSEGLITACRLQSHVPVACQEAAGAAQLLHGLLLEGLTHKDTHTRNRALHLLQITVESGCGPKVAGFGDIQWQAFMAMFRVQEEHVLHLIEPVWKDNYPVLWQQIGSASSSSSTTSSPRLSDLVRWCSVLLLRAAFHSNVSMRRLGLAACFELDASTLRHIIQLGGWQQLQALLLEILAAFDNDKLVLETSAGSAMSRQVQAVQAVQQQLTKYLVKCMAALQALPEQQQQQQRRGEQPEQQQGQQQQLLQELIARYLDRVCEVATRAPTAALLLQALSDAAQASCSNSIQLLCTWAPQQLLPRFGHVLNHISYLHPAYLRPGMQRTVLQMVPTACQAESCDAATAISILRAGGVSAAVAAGGFLLWLVNVLEAPPKAAATSVSATAELQAAAAVVHADAAGRTVPMASAASQLQAWLQPLLQCDGAVPVKTGSINSSCCTHNGHSSSGPQPLPSHKLLHSLGEVAADLSDSCQFVISNLLSAGANALEAGRCCPAAAAAFASLACGAATTMHNQAADAGVAAAAVVSSASKNTPSVIQNSLWGLVPALLQLHHKQVVAGSVRDVGLVDCLMQLLQHLRQPQPSPAQQQTIVSVQQLPTAVEAVLVSWVQQLLATVTAAAASSCLNQQLMLLCQAHMACFALPQHTELAFGDVPASSGQTRTMLLDTSGLWQCVQQLCCLQPANAVHALKAAGCTSSSRAKLTETVLEQRGAVLALLVTAVPQQQLPTQIRKQVFARYLEELEWGCQGATLQHALHTLLAVAPFDILQQGAGQQQQHMPQQLQQQQPQQQHGGCDADGGDTWELSDAVQHLQCLLRLLQPVVSSAGRLSVSIAQQLVQLFFHPSMFTCREIQATLGAQLLPYALTQGGVHLSVCVMTHMCHDTLSKQPQLLDVYLPHTAHMCAFSLFAETVSKEAALQQQKCDAAVLLPARVVLCAHLVQLARDGSQQSFMQQLLSRLFDIAEASGPYAWLSGREASQASGANAIKVSVWQALCLLAPYVDNIRRPEVMLRGWACLLNSHAHANIRPHVQLFMLAVFEKQPDAVTQYLLPALNAYNTTSYQVTVSVVIIVLFLLLELQPGSSPHFMPLLKAVLPWALHHRHAVRIPVQVLLHLVFSRHMTAIQQQLGQEAAGLMHQIQSFLTDNDETAKLRERQGLVDLAGFSLDYETSLEGVFGVREPLEQHCDGENDTKGLLWHCHVRDRLPLDILKYLPGAMKAIGRRYHKKAAAAAQGGGGMKAKEGEQLANDALGGEQAGASLGVEDGAAAGAGPAFYQFRPQVQFLPFDDAIADRIEALVAGRAARRGLVVCATLLDNLPNLAGLCRTCESMSVEALVLSNRSVTFTDAFKRQSVTSERWLRLLEVTVPDLPTLLRERKEDGYTIIGVEQATNSIPLQSYSFPECCVLLIGNEQNGIPVNLLPLLDVCLEIPMMGVTRSLNAHVTGAMVVWQYTQQRLPSTETSI